MYRVVSFCFVAFVVVDLSLFIDVCVRWHIVSSCCACGPTLVPSPDPRSLTMELSKAEIADLCESDDLSRYHASWPRYINEWPVEVGSGSFFTYFSAEYDLVKTLHVAQTLIFTGELTLEPRVPTSPLVSSVLDSFSSGQYLDLFGLPEQLGLFLIWRTTNRANMLFCCACFQTQVVRIVRACIMSRLRREFLIGRKIVLGCACLRCEIGWLEAGWSCPLALFIRSSNTSRSLE